MQNPTLVVLTDRNDLDDQLFGQFQRCADILGQTPVQAANREKLREFYQNNGYYDFRVTSAVAELTPDQKDFYITFTVDEGRQYDFGEIKVETALEKLDGQVLQAVVPIKQGELFQGDLIETTIDALNSVSLDIHAGEFLAVWGPSGSGKSTLMNIIGLIDTPTQGKVSFCGQDTRLLADDELTDFRGKHIGFVFQNFNLVPVLSALENVMLPLQIQGVAEREASVRAAAALVDVGLERFRHSLPDKLSGGQRQRVAIARALVVNPKLVIADEPTANLDSENSRMVIELMRAMNRARRVTFIFTTHDPRLLDHVDRKILLRDGQIETDEVLQ